MTDIGVKVNSGLEWNNMIRESRQARCSGKNFSPYFGAVSTPFLFKELGCCEVFPLPGVALAGPSFLAALCCTSRVQRWGKEHCKGNNPAGERASFQADTGLFL